MVPVPIPVHALKAIGNGNRESVRDDVAGRVRADTAGFDERGERADQHRVADMAALPKRGGGQRRRRVCDLRLDLVGQRGRRRDRATAGAGAARSIAMSATVLPSSASWSETAVIASCSPWRRR